MTFSPDRLATDWWCNKLESLSFDVHLNLASGLRVARRILEQDTTVKAIIAAARNDTNVVARLLSRLGGLLAEDAPDVHDSAVSAYLFIFEQIDPVHAALVAGRIARNPRLFWAAQLAQRLLEKMPPQQPARLVSVVPRFEGSSTSVQAALFGGEKAYFPGQRNVA